MNDRPFLKLLAKDDQDLQIVAAVVQDAIAPVSEMTYRADEKNFVMVVHRFMWDCAAAEEGGACVYDRIACALDIGGVTGVQFQGFDPNVSGTMLDLLTMVLEEGILSLHENSRQVMSGPREDGGSPDGNTLQEQPHRSGKPPARRESRMKKTDEMPGISAETRYTLTFIFAGGAKLRLTLADWRLKLRDFGESWPTTHRPRHAT